MRISDWSSDVCSSDLLCHAHEAAPARGCRHRRRRCRSRAEECPPAPGRFLYGSEGDRVMTIDPAKLTIAEALDGLAKKDFTSAEQIGRAWCRERVGQYG